MGAALSQGLKSEKAPCFSSLELFTDGGPEMLVGGKRERKKRIPLEISFFPCWESCDRELRKDLKHIRFPLER